MLRGRAVLKDLAAHIDRAHARFEEAADGLRRAETRQQTLLEEEHRTLEELARVYLPDLSPEAVARGIDELRDRLTQALEVQEERRQELARDLASAVDKIRAAEARAESLDAKAEGLAARLDEARSRVEGVLDADDEHAAQVEEHATLMAIADRLRNRRERLATTASAERRHYESDRLFRYLLDRDYGGPSYRAGPVARRLDRWVARRIDYETLSRSYRILRYGPARISAEIRRARGRAEELERSIDAREAKVSRQEGLLPLIEQHLDLESRMNEAQAAVDRARSRWAALNAEISAIAVHRGRDFEAALELHRDYLARKTIRELEALARSRPDARDERLVDRLDEIRRERERTTSELEAFRRKMERTAERIDRLAELHSTGIERFAGANSTFPDDFDVGSVLEAFASGEADLDEVLGQLREARVDGSLFVEVDRPYFDAVYRELTAAFDSGMGQGDVVEAEWSLEDGVETEVVVHDADGRVLRRRVTRRSLGDSREG